MRRLPELAKSLEAEVMAVVDQQLGAVARPARVYFVPMLPKTRSGNLAPLYSSGV